MTRYFVLLSLLPAAALAGEPINSTFFGNKAVDGTDVVAYFTDQKPTPGKKEFAYVWKGATWLFASAEHRDLFKASPEKYAPQYGGFCAFAMARGDKVGIDPAAWVIIDGKLYLNYDLDIKKKWDMDRATYIQKADQAWARLIQN